MRKTLNNIKAWLRFIQVYSDYCLWFLGFKTSSAKDQSRLIDLYCKTGGRGVELIYTLTSWTRPKAGASLGETSLIPALDQGKRAEAVLQLEASGFYVFPSRFPKSALENLVEFALKTPAQPRPARNKNEKTIIDLQFPKDSAYHFDRNDLVHLSSIQSLLMDPTVLKIASGYLKTQPIVTNVGMWWSTPFQASKNQDELAQRFHFDLDMLKWIKLFVYLVDVDSGNGAHSFVEGTHRPGRIPASLLAKGYQRLSDNEVEEACGVEKIRIMEGLAGTMFFENTVGLHKGKVPLTGNRLVLEVEMAGSEYGSPPRKPMVLNPADCSEPFLRAIQQQTTYRHFQIKSNEALSA